MRRHYFDLSARELSNRPILLMEEERHRLARDLHDDLLQTLTALDLRLDLCTQLASKNDSAALEEELSRLKTCWERSLRAIRQLDAGARGLASDYDSLSEAVGYLAGWYEEQTGVDVSLDLERLPEGELSSGQRETLLRIIQEALRNAHQHASASRVLIWAENSQGSLQVHVEDDGVGFSLASVTSDYPLQGLGLAGMVERARAEGGQLLIESEPGRGTRLTLILPLGRPRQPEINAGQLRD
jgi:signal transduction histidine kinase